MTDRELMQQALEWIDAQHEPRMIGAHKVIQALRARLAQPERVHTTYTSEERVNKTQKNEHEPVVEGWPLYSGLPKPEPVACIGTDILAADIRARRER